MLFSADKKGVQIFADFRLLAVHYSQWTIYQVHFIIVVLVVYTIIILATCCKKAQNLHSDDYQSDSHLCSRIKY